MWTSAYGAAMGCEGCGCVDAGGYGGCDVADAGVGGKDGRVNGDAALREKGCCCGGCRGSMARLGARRRPLGACCVWLLLLCHYCLCRTWAEVAVAVAVVVAIAIVVIVVVVVVICGSCRGPVSGVGLWDSGSLACLCSCWMLDGAC